MNLLRNLGFDSPSWEDLSYLLIGIIVAASLIGAAWAQWEKHQQDPWLRLLNNARQQLARTGLHLPANLPPRSLAGHLQNAPGLSPAAVAQWTDWLLQLESWRYAMAQLPGDPRQASLAKLRQQFARLPKPA